MISLVFWILGAIAAASGHEVATSHQSIVSGEGWRYGYAIAHGPYGIGHAVGESYPHGYGGFGAYAPAYGYTEGPIPLPPHEPLLIGIPPPPPEPLIIIPPHPSPHYPSPHHPSPLVPIVPPQYVPHYINQYQHYPRYPHPYVHPYVHYYDDDDDDDDDDYDYKK